MPTTTVNTPGGPITVNHPEGASDEDILEFAKREYEAEIQEKDARLAELVASNPAEFDPSSPEFRERYGASGNVFQNVAAGAGKFLADSARGIGQLAGVVDQESIDRARQRDADLMNTKAGLAGNVLGGAAFSAPLAAIPGVNTATGATLLGAGIGAAQPVATGESRGVNAVVGGAGGFSGQRLGRLLGRGPDGPVDGLNIAEREALRRGRELGFRATPGVASGSKPLRKFEAMLESKPYTAGAIDSIKDQNQVVANRIVARSIGELDEVVDSTTLGNAHSRMSQEFEDFAASIPAARFDSQRAGQVLNEIASEAADLTDMPLQSNPLFQKVSKMVASGEASGEMLRTYTSKLGKKADSVMRSAAGDKTLGRALFKVKDLVDDIIESQLDETQSAAYQLLREQYRNYKLITSRTGIINPSSGNVNLNSLAGALQSKDASGFLRGGNQSALYGAARFGQAFRPVVGDSGTGTRNTGILDTIAGLPLGAAAHAYASPTSTALIGGSNQTLGNIGRLLGPAADPRLLAVLGANSATAAN